MENISTRTWSMIGFIGLLVFFSYWMRFAHNHPGWNPITMGFTYEMPRTRHFDLGFDLSDREIERHYKTMKVVTPADLKKKEDPKKVDPKQAQKEADAKKKAAQAAQAAARKTQDRRPKADVNLVDTSLQTGLSADENATAGGAATWAGYAGAGVAAHAAAPGVEGTDKKDDDTALTAAQWRSLLQSQPTAENIAKFIKAKQSGKLDAASYYQIVHELLTDSAKDRYQAGLSVVNADISAGTYVFVVTELAGSPTAEEQTDLKKSEAGYSSAAEIGILAQVLSSAQTPAVLAAATASLSVAIDNYKQQLQNSEQGQTVGETTGTRTVAGGFTAQQFNAFLAPLQTLAQNQSSGVSSQATELATEIKGLTETNS